MNWSLTTLSLPVIGDWGLSNVFSFLNIVKQFLVLTCLVLCLCQPALHQYISLYSIISLTYSLSIYKIKENVKLVYWFICTIKQDTGWVTAAAGSLANLEVILLQKNYVSLA